MPDQSTPLDDELFPTGEICKRYKVVPRSVNRWVRKEARDEIDRLIRFLDESDDHMEREPDGDEEDVSYPHAGPRPTVGISEDDEDGADDELSLGSSGHYDAGPIF